MKKICSSISILLVLLMCMALVSCGDTPAEETEYTYENIFGENFTFTVGSAEPEILCKLPSELYDEWQQNVASAEATYNKEGTYIITEGYITDISKSLDEYIVTVSDGSLASFLGKNTLWVHFSTEEAIAQLREVSKADYVVLLCTANDDEFYGDLPQMSAIEMRTSSEADPIEFEDPDGVDGDLVDDPENGSDEGQNGDAVPPVKATGPELEKYMGNDISAIINDLGSNYDTFYALGSNYLYYENGARAFSFGAHDAPQEGDKVTAVYAYADGTRVFGDIAIGSSLKAVETAVGHKLDLFESFEFGDEDTVIERNGYRYYLSFTDDVLITAICMQESYE